jgi:hypothetical protein
MAQAGIAANVPPANAQIALDGNTQGAQAPQQPAPYELVDGEEIVKAKDALTEVASLQQILYWIVFTINEHRENIHTQSLGSYEEIQSLTKKDCQAIATDWAGQFHVGLKGLKLLQALVHWVQDFRHTSSMSSIVGLNAITFKSVLSCALDHATIQKSLQDHHQDHWRANDNGKYGKRSLSIIVVHVSVPMAFRFPTSLEKMMNLLQIPILMILPLRQLPALR